MNNILNILFLKHKTWVRYVKSFGCAENTAEDYVQEMYIKIFNYTQKTNADLMYNEDELNYFFIYVTLKNLYFDNLRKNKKDLIVSLSNLHKELEEEEDKTFLNDFDNQKEKLKIWKNNLEFKLYKLKKYSREKNNLIYLKFIYEKIFEQNISITKLSKDVGITYWSLRNTILIIKEQIKNTNEI